MDILIVKNFFIWCSIINGGFLIIMFLIYVLAGDSSYQMHSKLFPISRQAFNIAFYCFLGMYKMFFWVFCLIPFIVLTIIE